MLKLKIKPLAINQKIILQVSNLFLLRKRWEESPTLKNFSVVGFGDFLSQAINIGSAILLIRALSVSDYALFSAMNGIANLSAGIIGTGINLALVRFSTDYLSQTGKQPTSIYIFVLAFQISLYILITFLSLLFPSFATSILLGQSDFQAALQFGLLYGMGILLTQLGRSVYQAEEKFKHFIGVLILRQAITLGAIVFLWLFKILTYNSVSIVISTVYIILGVWIFVKSAKVGQFIKQYQNVYVELKGYLRNFLSATGWLIGYFIIITVISQVDILTLARFSTKEELAVYGVAVKYYSLGLLFLGSINSVLLPKFSHIDMQDFVRQRSFTKKWIKTFSLLIFPILIFDIFAKPLFIWINGDQYNQAFSIFVVFSIGIWLSFMLSPQVNILISRGNFRFLFFISAIALLFCIIGDLIVVRQWGGIGIAIVTVITYNILIQTPILIKAINHS